jgi:Major capsid protein N-terminus/Large eukaryotic DNA virus major capsid protein
MTGGLLNLVATGNQNVILNGNPKKSFFKSTYLKYTNFGLQKFRVDFDGQKKLRMTEESKFTFYIPRYAELLMDTYICVTLPSIWSPIHPPTTANDMWAPYEFRWIENIGTQMVKEIVISVGGMTLQRFTGNNLMAILERDLDNTKRELYNQMTGHVPELYNPGCSGARLNQYPNAYRTSNIAGAEPSIRGRKIYIPINAWFTLSSKMAFPLVCLQYNQLQIDVTLRPVKELFTIRDVGDPENFWPVVQPDFTNPLHQMWRFLYPPPSIDLSLNSYPSIRTDWNADVHLMATYCFLSDEESKVFAANQQKYLIKSYYDWVFNDVTGNKKIKIENSMGMVASWTMFFQRSDVNLRNEWSNYTNWPYNYLPYDIIPAPIDDDWRPVAFTEDIRQTTDLLTNLNPAFANDRYFFDKNGPKNGIGPGINPRDKRLTGLHITGDFQSENERDILQMLGISLNGKYRENLLDAGVYNYVEKYTRTRGSAKPGIYCYNFCLNSDPFDLQPSGAINMSKFNQIELELTTIYPPLDFAAEVKVICNPNTREIIGMNKPNVNIYLYNYDLHILEERYNVLTFVSGNCGLMYAR